MEVNDYNVYVKNEMFRWQKEMNAPAKKTNQLAKNFQNRVNRIIPEKAHKIITDGIRNMVKAVINGSTYMTKAPCTKGSLLEREMKVREIMGTYKNLALASGFGTGAGGLVLGLADFPLLLSIKMKFLFEVASCYGFDVKNYKERLFILYVFQIAFSSQECRHKTYKIISNWDEYAKRLPINQDVFDWRHFQQEYRDYLDVAKFLQLMPVIGGVVGAYTNQKLVNQLGDAAMNAYRMRWYAKIKQKAKKVM